ncbi:RimJ/RimL family protein N-acetyltransferase [Catenuloplanes indicus]|uniref:RimJ/RimL family protein N-acetyltransferase n=1 Tax=Catenuloplanes indicus TaxID=137267 RepID=A0AAE3VYG9_9ACTN|nr:RimJ/RimL family protein N-acetyltransferase [Catenuloplanes indicus]
MHAIVGDDRVTQYLSFDSRTMEQSIEMVAGAIERSRHHARNEFYLAVTRGDDKLIGFTRLALGGVRAAKIGYAVNADQWGCGYATDSVHILINFGFDQLALRRITAAIGPNNAASLAIARKVGMKYEGRLRDHVFTNGSWRDSLLYSLLSTD